MKETATIAVAFNKDSFTIFNSEALALEFIEKEEKKGRIWSITPGKLEYDTPYYKESEDD